MAVMFVSAGWAMVYKLRQFCASWQATHDTSDASLFLGGLAILLPTAWLIIEALTAFTKSTARKRLPAAHPGPASD